MMTRICLTLFSLLAAMSVVAQPSVSVSDEWVRATPPGSRMTAGYMVLRNNSGQDIAVSSIASPQFERVEMHQTTMTDGIARMEKLEALVIPAGAQVALAPGGLHLMLIGARRELTDGEPVTLHLVFDDGWELEVEAPVRRR